VSLSPLYAILQYVKLLPATPRFHAWYTSKCQLLQKSKLKLATLENSFKVQVFTQFFLETLPQLILQVTINNSQVWDGPAKFSFAMSIMLFLRDITLITMYVIKRFIDNGGSQDEPLIRPLAEGKYVTRVEMDADANISGYLQDQRDENIDEIGNTSLHALTKGQEGVQEMES
jgi:hypothetical protein